MSKRYFEFKEAGLCTRCGGERLEGKTRCAQCHALHLEYQAKCKLKAKAKGICRYCLTNPAETSKSMCEPCLVKHSEKNKAIYAAHRAACIEAYGGKCNCCKLDKEKYLQLDHINNDGAEHRKELSNSRKGSIYTWAFRNDFPPILQLLCANCHQAKTTNKPCTAEDHAWLKQSTN